MNNEFKNMGRSDSSFSAPSEFIIRLTVSDTLDLSTRQLLHREADLRWCEWWARPQLVLGTVRSRGQC